MEVQYFQVCEARRSLRTSVERSRGLYVHPTQQSREQKKYFSISLARLRLSCSMYT
jgi:hypothetical protein